MDFGETYKSASDRLCNVNQYTCFPLCFNKSRFSDACIYFAIGLLRIGKDAGLGLALDGVLI